MCSPPTARSMQPSPAASISPTTLSSFSAIPASAPSNLPTLLTSMPTLSATSQHKVPVQPMIYSPGYVIKSVYQSTTTGICNGAVSASAQLIGVCNPGSCLAFGCAASVMYVAAGDSNSSNFVVSYVEFANAACDSNSVIADTISTKTYSTACSEGVQISYYAGDPLPDEAFPLVIGGLVRR